MFCCTYGLMTWGGWHLGGERFGSVEESILIGEISDMKMKEPNDQKLKLTGKALLQIFCLEVCRIMDCKTGKMKGRDSPTRS